MTGVHVIVAGTEQEAHELRRADLRVPDCSAVVVLSIRSGARELIRGLLVHSWAMTEYARLQDAWGEVTELLRYLASVHRDTPAHDGVARERTFE